MECNKRTKLNRITKYLYLYNIFPLLTGSDFTTLPTVNKLLNNLIIEYKAMYESDLKQLSIDWKFFIDEIDIDRVTASKSKRLYLTSTAGEYRLIKANTIGCTSSATFGKLKKVNNSHIVIIEDVGSICGGRILHFKFHHDLYLTLSCSHLKKGRYKLFIRESYNTKKFSEVIYCVEVKENQKKSVKIYEESLMSEDQFVSLNAEVREKSEINNTSSRTTNSINSVSLINRYCTELDLNDFDDSENLQVFVRFESKKANETLLGWCIEGIILEYVL